MSDVRGERPGEVGLPRREFLKKATAAVFVTPVVVSFFLDGVAEAAVTRHTLGNQTVPNQTDPNQTNPNQTYPNQHHGHHGRHKGRHRGRRGKHGQFGRGGGSSV